MRWVGQGLVALLLVGCSRENPWFALNTAGAAESESSQPGTTTAGSGESDASTANSSDDSGAVSASTSTTSTTTSTTTGTTTSMTSTSTTDPVDSSSTSGSSSSDTMGSTGASTGEPGQKVILDLYVACPGAKWTDEKIIEYPCPGVNDVPLVNLIQTMYEGQPANAVVAYPTQKFDSFLDGGYKVELAGAVNPRFQAELWFPVTDAPTDKLTGSVYVLVDMQILGQFTENIVLKPGQSATIDLDLGQVPPDAELVELHLQVLIESSAKQQVEGRWLNPRIIDLQ